MSKVICDICGTTYPDTADCCPICGCSRDATMDLLGDAFELEDIQEEPRSRKGRYSGKKRKEIFDYDEVNPQEDQTQFLEETAEDEENYEYEDRPRSNTFVVILLTVLIAVLLLAAGFLFFRYILPNVRGEAPADPVSQVQTTDAAEEAETTMYQVPCTNMSLLSGALAELTEEGGYFLLHVNVMPEDTTDTVTFVSADESIATVDGNGRITAVSEGETLIYITCGNIQQTCRVVCEFVEDETEPPTEETAAETEAPTEPPFRTDVTLKLKKTDIMLSVYYGFRLELDCDLKPEDVEWSVEHPHIASVDETGLVTALKAGTTDVIVKYGDQEVRCIVRCS